MSSYDPNGQLWRWNMGIRFSPTPEPPQLYPKLDHPRFLHAGNGDAVENISCTNGQAINPDEKDQNFKSDESPKSAGGWGSPAAQKAPEKATEEAHIAVTDQSAISSLAARIQSQSASPPKTSLQYQMSAESFRKARASSKGSAGSYWSHLMYKKVDADGTPRNVKVHYCTSKQTTEWVCKKYFAEEKVLGFDLEWSPWATKDLGARDNVSLIQLASESRIGLFHVALFSKDDFVAPTFKTIMEDATVSKVGVAIKADCTRLSNYLGIESKGIFELSHMYKQVKYVRERKPKLINKLLVTLATQVEACLGLPLYKGDSVRASDWTRHLNVRQITYSAADAYAGVQLYHVLDQKRQELDPCPPRPFHSELKIPIPIPEEIIEDHDGEVQAAGGDNQADTFVVEGSTATPDTVASKFRDTRLVAADGKVQRYRSTKRRSIRVGPSALRAYYVWHDNQELKPGDVAALLRDPPLQTNTVTSYILNAVTGENLPYSKDRMARELLPTLTDAAANSERYKTLIEACRPQEAEVDS